MKRRIPHGRKLGRMAHRLLAITLIVLNEALRTFRNIRRLREARHLSKLLQFYALGLVFPLKRINFCKILILQYP